MSLRALIALLPLAAVVGGCDRAAAPNAQTAAAPVQLTSGAGKLDRGQAGQPMPDTPFKAPDGRTMRLADFKGQPVLVNLWATWCAPCVKEMPSLDRLAAREKRLRVVTISQDSMSRTVDPVPKWWANAGLKNLQPYRDADMTLGFEFAGGVLPTTVLYDAGGREVWRVAGDAEWDGPEAAKLIGEAFK